VLLVSQPRTNFFIQIPKKSSSSKINNKNANILASQLETINNGRKITMQKDKTKSKESSLLNVSLLKDTPVLYFLIVFALFVNM